jgi:hypothetical protein
LRDQKIEEKNWGVREQQLKSYLDKQKEINK